MDPRGRALTASARRPASNGVGALRRQSAPTAAASETRLRAIVVRPEEMPADLIAQWRRFQDASPDLDSPFFSPDFALAVAATRQDTRVAVLERAGEPLGFLAFHDRGSGIAKPVGGQISDYQGIVEAPGAAFDGAAVLAACGLRAFDFNHAPVSQSALRSGAIGFASSPVIDLSAGYDAYIAGLPKAGRHAVKETQRRCRKIEREIGPLRFTLHDDSDAAWHSLITLKNDSFRRMNARARLEAGWVLDALQTIRRTGHAAFAGLLSTVHAGDRLIAAHLGMRTATTWCWWFNTYDPEFRIFAPGLIVLLEAARAAPGLGVRRIDFGRGTQHYKLTFATGAVDLCEGSIARRASVPWALRRFQGSAVRMLRPMPAGRLSSLARRGLTRAISNVALPEG